MMVSTCSSTMLETWMSSMLVNLTSTTLASLMSTTPGTLAGSMLGRVPRAGSCMIQSYALSVVQKDLGRWRT